jgi:hypothetical protein
MAEASYVHGGKSDVRQKGKNHAKRVKSKQQKLNLISSMRSLKYRSRSPTYMKQNRKSTVTKLKGDLMFSTD